MQPFWLSVLIPVYNVEAYLTACMESVISQADAGVEIVLLNDCSPDNSPRLMQALQARWPEHTIRLLTHEKNQGLSATRNHLLAAATGEYIWFLDSDDQLMPGAIAGVREAVQTHQPDVVLCDFQMLRQTQRLKHRLRGEGHRRTFVGPANVRIDGTDALLAGLLITGQLHPWSKVSKRALWGEDLRFPVGRYFEDMATMPRLVLRAQSAVYCPQPWLGYRQHGSSVLANLTLERLADLSGALRVFRQEWAQCRSLKPSAASQFAASHMAARNFVGTMKVWKKAASPDPQWAAQFWQDFETSSVLPLGDLLRAYAQRGWLLRAWRLRHFAALAQSAQHTLSAPPRALTQGQAKTQAHTQAQAREAQDR